MLNILKNKKILQSYESVFETEISKDVLDSNITWLTSKLKNSFINHSTYYIFWKNNKLAFGGCNQRFAYRFDLNSPHKIIGKTDDEFPWREDLRKKYITDDQKILKTGIPKINFIEQQRQFDGSIENVLVSKIPVIQQKEVVGILGAYIYIEKTKKNGLSVLLSPSKAQEKLTPKEKQCVYYLVKGYSMKETARALNNSPRTIETHFERIKLKLQCYNKSQIIEKAFEEEILI